MVGRVSYILVREPAPHAKPCRYFFVTPELDVYLNEINTMPGFTATSMFPRMWAESGLPYPKLVARLVRTALRRSG